MQITDLVYIDATGYHFSDYPSFLSWLQDQYRGIYGADVYLESDSQDGQFLAILAKGYYDMAALGASVYNSFSPVTAQGVGLARNVKINGLTKRVATKSTVEVTIVGQTGTVITNGVAIDTLNQKWDIPTTTIPGGGTIDVTATAQVAGALTAEANTVNRIFTPTLGWQTVNNDNAATPGEPVETDAELRVRQQNSTANPSLTVFDGTIGGVANLAGVTKVRGYENDTGSTDGNGLPAHSISIVALGGDEDAIANEIALHKTPGTQTYAVGGTSVHKTVYDAHGMPLVINFYTPVSVTIKVQITIAVNSGWSNDFITSIQEAVAAQINGNRIGDNVLITKLFAPAYLFGTPASQTFDISDLQIGKNSDPLGVVNIDLAFNENAICVADTDVTVIVT